MHLSRLQKKEFSWLILPILIAVFLLGRVYFHAGFPYTHDGENHLARFANYAIAVREGQIPPRFAPNLLNHYGYPAFDFNYPLANILSLPFSFLRINPEVTFKILACLGVALGAYGSYLWLGELTHNRQTKILGIFVFAANLYLVNTIFFRGSIGEILAICLLPWAFWSVDVVLSSFNKVHKFILPIIIFSALALSHNITFVLSVPLLFTYALARTEWHEREKILKKWGSLALVGLAAAGLTLWFWLPALLEKSATVVDQVGVNSEFLTQFPSLAQLLWSPQRFGFSYLGSIDSLSFGLGFLQVVALIMGGWILLSKKSTRVFLWLWLMLVIVCLTQLEITKPLWLLVFPIAKYIQFPWRLGLFWGVLSIPLVALTWEKLPRLGKSIILLLLIWQLIALTRLKAVDYFHHDLTDYIFFSQSTSTLNENRAQTFTYLNLGDWQPAPHLLTGSGQITVQAWRGSNRSYTLQLQTQSLIVEPTMNFLGWQTTANGQRVKYLNSDEIGGRIAYSLPAGSYQVHSQFTQWTWPRMIGNGASTTISVVILILFGRLGYLGFKRRQHDQN